MFPTQACSQALGTMVVFPTLALFGLFQLNSQFTAQILWIGFNSINWSRSEAVSNKPITGV